MNAARISCAVFLTSLLVLSCKGGGGSGPTPPALHAISGTAADAPGATVALTGAATATTTADASGRYRFSALADGTYAVAPSLSGHSFSPVSTTVVLAGADRTGVDFAATATSAPTHTLSGTVADAPNATIALSGAASATTAADARGQYQFAGLADGSYTVTPALAGFTFTPARRDVDLAGADVSGLDFTGVTTATPTHTLSGTVAGAPGATIALTGTASATTAADASGHYRFTGLADGTYAVAPSLSGFVFDPVSAPVTLAGADVSGVDFTATAVPTPTHVLSGTISGAANVAVALTGAATAATTTDAGGHYQFTGLADGGYTITPALAGFSFAPPSRTVTLSGADLASLDFTATAITHSISGTISPMGPALTLSLSSGATTAPVPVSSDGHFLVSGLVDGSYTLQLEISRALVDTCPSWSESTTVQLQGADAEVSFRNVTASCQMHVSGTVSPARGGIQIDLSGDRTLSALTDGSGRYEFSGLYPGAYVVTPRWAASSGPRNVRVSVGNVDGVDFSIDPRGVVILFPTTERYTGDFGGRAGADAACAAARIPICAAASNLHAVLTVTKTDRIGNMAESFGLPTDLPVRRPDGTLVANDWPSMFSGTLLSPTLDNNGTYWTGGNPDPADSRALWNCLGWTTSSDFSSGFFGYGSVTDSKSGSWAEGSAWRCDQADALLCACW